MKPYYESARSLVYLGDARDVLTDIDGESIDLVVTDPPYGVNWQSNTRKQKFDRIAGDSKDHARDLLADLAPEIVRVTRRTRHIYTFGIEIQHPLLAVKAHLVWDKGRIGSGDLSLLWGPSHEPIFFHVRAADKTNADRNSGSLAARLRRESVIRVRRLSANQVKLHPTQKPVGLMRQLVESSSGVSETVLDPFAGSGSTLVASVLSGRRAVGVELEEQYAEVIVKRLRQAEQLADLMEAA